MEAHRPEFRVAKMAKALNVTKASKGLLVHSDRGLQVRRHGYQEVLKKNGLMQHESSW